MENKQVQEWLSEYQNPRTKALNKGRIAKFLAWYDKDASELIKLSTKDAKHLLLQYQAEQVKEGIPNNSVIAILTSVRAFFKYLEKPLVFGRGRLVQQQEAQNKHSFSNGDLSHMFEIGDIRDKAMIALGSSLGWAISDVLALDRKELETLIARAKENNENFVFFKKRRGKTNAKSYGIINPLAVEWLTKWFAKHKGAKIFDINATMINRTLQKLAKEAQLKLLGNVTYHCFRSWTFSSLVKAGFSEFEAKYIVGKKLPISDSTYLTLEEGIQDKYKEAYDKYFNITSSKTSESVALKEENKQQRAMIKTLIEKVEQLEQGFNRMTTDTNDRLATIENKLKIKSKVKEFT